MEQGAAGGAVEFGGAPIGVPFAKLRRLHRDRRVVHPAHQFPFPGGAHRAKSGDLNGVHFHIERRRENGGFAHSMD